MCTRDSSISKASRVPYLQHAGDAGGRVKMCARDTQLRRFELNTTTTLLFKMYAEIIITIPPTQCAARMTCRQRRGRRGPGASERHQYNIKYNIISQHHFAKSCATRATPSGPTLRCVRRLTRRRWTPPASTSTAARAGRRHRPVRDPGSPPGPTAWV